ncbi:MAG TPA: VOC family protein [Allosphingosinicella sp.]|nr:VOC family protein [Allosphingosinicella sp.]
MLKDKSSSAIVAVRDLDRARHFYGGTLGLSLDAEGPQGVLAYRTGATRLIVYRSDAAGTNRANAVVWGCGDEIDAIVADLEAKGVVFEHYPEMEGLRIEGNVHVAGPMKMVWFKDPDGNILHLNNI